MKRMIEHTDDGSATLYVPELDEHYHSVKGAFTEAEHIFIRMGLEASSAPVPRVLEVGFGTGLNAFLTLKEAELKHRSVKYTGIELYPLQWSEIEPLHYSEDPLFKELHWVPWQTDEPLTSYFTLKKVQSDIHTFLSETKGTWDVVYYDAFAPEKQPDMWEEEIFCLLKKHMHTGAVLTTYCAKGVVRRMLQKIGFKVERLPGPPGGKREILRAIVVSSKQT